ncbi:MAG: hypothetical protein J0I11_16270 [Actinobacteria bacterium]|jgi:hypothetical protein|nr:hypothetical protein [Actinomycetota bacterium]
MTGAMWLLMGAFSPLATMRFVTFAGGELARPHPGVGSEVVGNMNTAGT